MKKKECVISARGIETEGEARRYKYHIHLEWYKMGKKYSHVLFEPHFIDLSPALVDLLIFALEEKPRVNSINICT